MVGDANDPSNTAGRLARRTRSTPISISGRAITPSSHISDMAYTILYDIIAYAHANGSWAICHRPLYTRRNPANAAPQHPILTSVSTPSAVVSADSGNNKISAESGLAM